MAVPVPQIPVFVGGQMTDLPTFPGAQLVGNELFEIVSPPNVDQALNYSVSSGLLALMIVGISNPGIFVLDGGTAPAPFIPLNTISRYLFKTTLALPSFVQFDLASTYPGPILIKDQKGDADVRPITVTFSGGQLVDGLATVTISTPYGGYWFTPLPDNSGFYLGTA